MMNRPLPRLWRWRWRWQQHQHQHQPPLSLYLPLLLLLLAVAAPPPLASALVYPIDTVLPAYTADQLSDGNVGYSFQLLIPSTFKPFGLEATASVSIDIQVEVSVVWCITQLAAAELISG